MTEGEIEDYLASMVYKLFLDGNESRQVKARIRQRLTAVCAEYGSARRPTTLNPMLVGTPVNLAVRHRFTEQRNCC
jgi:hypothetical protein